MTDFRQRLLATTLLVGASVVASPAFAQDTQTPKPLCPPGAPPPGANCTAQDAPTSNQPETTAPVEGTTTPSTNAQGAPVQSGGDIVITGSRIPQPNLTSASPVTVLNSQDIKLQGTTRTEDLINSLPQSFAAQGSNISNGSTGTASVNLRGLGSQRTLVLVNGRRLQPGDPRLGSIADINFIPSAIVKRVDVLTGGASSVYGADAVAGVVNFIMDTNFRGLRIDAQASTFMHYNDASDRILNANVARGFRPPHGQSVNGGAQDLAVAFGAGFDDNRGWIMAYATYRKQDAVLEASRDYSFCSLAARTAAQGGLAAARRPRDFNCGGSATSATGTFFTNVGTFPGRWPQRQQFRAGLDPVQLRPVQLLSSARTSATRSAPSPNMRSARGQAVPRSDVHGRPSNSRIAPSGDFFNTTTINCDNPLLSAQQITTICGACQFDHRCAYGYAGRHQAIVYIGRRNVEGGGREDHLEHNAWRIVGGIAATCSRACPTTLTISSARPAVAGLPERFLGHVDCNGARRHRQSGGRRRAGVAAGTPVCRATD